MDASRPDVAPASGGVATLPDSSISTSQISAMVAAAQSAQPLSAAYAGRSPAESHVPYYMGRNMVVHVMMDQRFPSRDLRLSGTQATAAASNPVAEECKSRKRKASSASSPKKAHLKIPPASLKADPDDEAPKSTTDTKDNACCICMCDPDPGEQSAIDGCGHNFCFDCIEKWSERENTCPLCKERFYKIERVHKKAKGKRACGAAKGKNTKKVKNRDQRADLNQGGNPLESLLANIGGMNGAFPPSIARLIFSGLGSTGLGLEMNARQIHQRRQNLGLPNWPGVNNRFEDNLLPSDDEVNTSDEDGYYSFIHGMRNTQSTGSTPIFGGFGPSVDSLAQNVPSADPRLVQQRFHVSLAGQQRSVMADMLPAPQIPPRNFASNYLQLGAGNTANSALEICGSDSDDDEIEVVQVTQGREI